MNKITQILLNALPGLNDMLHYQKKWLVNDVSAGLSVAAIQIPTAIAYAKMMGLPPQAGLYACILPMLIFAFCSSSRQLMIGPDAATATMVAAAIIPIANGDPTQLLNLSIIIAILVGLISIIAGLLRAGFLANFLSKPVLIGYLNGIGISLIVGQLIKFFGINIHSNDFVQILIDLLESVSTLNIQPPELIMGLGTLIVILFLKKFIPKIPSSLVTLVIAILVCFFLGMDRYHIKMLGEIPSGLPSLRLPHIDLNNISTLIRNSIGIAVVSFCSALLTARSFASKQGGMLNASHEFICLGFANIAAGISQGFAISGADSRTAVNTSSGGKTQFAAIVAALVIALCILVLYQVFKWIPEVSLAAILLIAGWNLIDITALKELFHVSRFEFGLSILTTLAVLTIGILDGILFAISVDIIRIFYDSYRPKDAILGWVAGVDGQVDIKHFPKATTEPSLMIYRFNANLLFYNAEYFKQRLLNLAKQQPDLKTILIDMETMNSIDITGILALKDVSVHLKENDIHLVLARVQGHTASLIKKSGLFPKFSPPYIFSSVRAGIKAFRVFRTNYPQFLENLALYEKQEIDY